MSIKNKKISLIGLKIGTVGVLVVIAAILIQVVNGVILYNDSTLKNVSVYISLFGIALGFFGAIAHYYMMFTKRDKN